MQKPIIIDMHSDLLSYLALTPSRTADDALSRSSLPQLQKGGVKLQTLALYTSNSNMAPAMLSSQLAALSSLHILHSSRVKKVDSSKVLDELTSLDDRVAVLPAFENSTGFADASAPFSLLEKNLDALKKHLGPIGYISMTWDGENRFGGGIGSRVGLKDDGRKLLAWMDKEHIPIDLSHASDFLIDAIFSEIEKCSYSLPVLASHSNFRSITDKERNLSDTFAEEIIRRKGLIGINFFRHFSKGARGQDIIEHILYGLELKGEKSLAFGADFFCDSDAPSLKEKYGSDTFFYKELSDSSCYETVTAWMGELPFLTSSKIEDIAYKNAQHFLSSAVTKQLMIHNGR